MMQDIEDQRRAKVTKIIRINPCGPEGITELMIPTKAKGTMQ